MALSESAIKRNRQDNKRKKGLEPKVKALMNPRLMPMGPIGGIPEGMLDILKDPDYERMYGLEDDRIESEQEALRNAAEAGLMKRFKKFSKGSSAKKKTKKKRPRGVGCAVKGYGKAMK
tara:strand:+ start:487 stop:843 length:357 start_codon:yes stop_codon:yes gene_type:complete